MTPEIAESPPELMVLSGKLPAGVYSATHALKRERLKEKWRRWADHAPLRSPASSLWPGPARPRLAWLVSVLSAAMVPP